MAEIRCPMCSRENPDDLDECQFCGARLKPLMAEGGSDAAGSLDPGSPDSGESQEGSQVPGWLARIRERANEDQGEDDQSDVEPKDDQQGGSPAWLRRLREVEPEEVGPPPGEVPEWARQGTDKAEDAPEAPTPEEGEGWLNRLRESDAAAEGVGEADDAAIPEETTDQSPPQAEMAVEEPASTELPGWLDEISEEIPPESELSTWQGEPPGPGLAPDEALEAEPGGPDQSEPLISDEAKFDSRPDAELDAPPAAEEAQAPEPEEPGAAGAEGEPSPPQPEPAFEGRFQEPVSEPFTEGFEGIEAGLPDWLDELDEDSGEMEDEPELEGLAEAELPGWIDEVRPPGDQGPQEPPPSEFEWEVDDYPPPEPEDSEPADLPHVPAFGAQSDTGGQIEGSDLDLDAIKLPEWLSDMRQDKEAPEPESPAERQNLAPATIPNWLEAMRPVETIQPVIELEGEEDETVESVGPLAGLSGVLMAEPVVAKPRTSTAVATGLEVTERQYAQADLLRRIVEDEQREMTGISAGRRRWPLVRWILALVVILAVGLIPISGVFRFAIPTVISRDLGAVVEQVNAVPVDRPVLMVFDYEPGYSAEVQAVAGPLMEHLFRRDLNVVTVSTKPTGPPLALELVGRAAQDHGAEAGRDFLHLGYLSGGPSAVQLFAANPRFTVLDGFMVPSAFGDQPIWEQPLLRDVTGLTDFGMVIVIVSGTDSARVWAEQAPPWLGETPLLMVLSAGAEPLVRPYFEALHPTVNGILTGLPAGVYYEQLNGKPGLAEQRWSAFGIGSFVIELSMLAGLGWGAFQWVIDLREKRVQR